MSPLVVFIYNLLLTIAYPILLLYLYIKALRTPGYRESLGERLGRYAAPPGADGKRTLWLHAVSVGEAAGAAPLVRMWRERRPDWKIVVSTTTVGGMQMLRKTFSGDVAAVYFPFDFPWVIGRALRAINPSVLAIMETELWPNLILGCSRRGVPVLLLNARVSDRMAAAPGPARAMYRRLFPAFRAIATQSDRDAERLRALGAPDNLMSTIGNLKFDGVLPSADDAKQEALRKTLSPDGAPLFVAGSTHPGEDEMVLVVFRQVRDAHPSMRMVLCPRHVERAADVLRIVHDAGMNAVLRSRVEGVPPEVVVMDTIGELRLLYAFATVCFVGGSLIERGGHNVLEPAAAGHAVFYGPHMANFRQAADILEAGGGGIPTKDADDLARKVIKYLGTPGERERRDAAAVQAVRANAGAAERAYRLLDEAASGRK